MAWAVVGVDCYEDVVVRLWGWSGVGLVVRDWGCGVDGMPRAVGEEG